MSSTAALPREETPFRRFVREFSDDCRFWVAHRR